MASIMVTGASGLLGRRTIESLLRKKHRIYGVDTRGSELVGTDPNFTFVQCDITDKNEIVSIMSSNSIEVVIHMANTVDNDLDSLVTDAELKQGKVVDKYIYDAAAKAGIRCFILISTTDVYGPQKGREPIRETTPEKGNSNYAELKLLSEKLMGKAFKKSDVIPVIARVSPVYDASHTENLHSHVYDAKDNVGYVFGEGDYGYTFCCVYNLVDFINGIVNVPTGRYDGVYNVCDSRQITAKEIIAFEKEKHLLGAVIQKNPSALSLNKGKMKTDYRYFDPSLSFNNWTFDNTRAKRICPMRWNLGNTK